MLKKVTKSEIVHPIKSTAVGDLVDCPACRQKQPVLKAVRAGYDVTACAACLTIVAVRGLVAKPLPKPTTETRPGLVEETR